MEFLENVGSGFKIIKDSFILLFKKPIFLVPIILNWIIITSIIIYITYYSSLGFSILGIFLLLFLIVYTTIFSNLIVLELIEQIETNGETSLGKALKEAIGIDLIKAFPIAVIWTILWFIILILKGFSKNKNKTKSEPSAENFAKTLGRSNNPFSWFSLGLSMIEKLIRMIVFMALPAIAWENKGSFKALGTSLHIIKKHPTEFLTTYSLTLVMGIIMGIPLAIIFTLSDNGVVFSEAFWVGVIIYEGIVWTLGMYFEQISVSLLYMWHLNWTKLGEKGNLSDLPRPNLLDEHFDLNTENHKQIIQTQSENDEKIKQYVLQYKTNYSRDSIKNGLLATKISEDKAEEYLNKYF
jgi:hypothetical protein